LEYPSPPHGGEYINKTKAKEVKTLCGLLLLSENLRQVNTEIFPQIHGYRPAGINVSSIVKPVLQPENLDRLPHRIYDPIFPDARPLVQPILQRQIMPPAGWGKDLDHHIRGALAAVAVQLVRITHNGDIRFQHGILVLRGILLFQEGADGKWRGIDLARLIVQVIRNQPVEFPSDLLGNPIRRGHHISFAVNDFNMLIFWPVKSIREALPLFFGRDCHMTPPPFYAIIPLPGWNTRDLRPWPIQFHSGVPSMRWEIDEEDKAKITA